MGYHEYQMSIEISKHNYPFYSLIMAAIMKADTDNLNALKFAFPHTWKELQDRWHLPQGKYPNE